MKFLDGYFFISWFDIEISVKEFSFFFFWKWYVINSECYLIFRVRLNTEISAKNPELV